MKKFISAILTVALLLSTCCAFAATSFSGSIAGYPVSTSNFKVYTSKSTNSSKVGTCYYDDYITIKQISGSWCQIEYPVSKGTKTGWCKTSNILVNDSFSTKTGTAQSKITVYTTYKCSSKLGTIYSGDDVMVVGTKSGNTQVIYPVSKGYKIGFVKGSYTISNGSLKTSSSSSGHSSSEWVEPMSKMYVCGNDWGTKYSKADQSRPYHAGIDVYSDSGDTKVYAAAAGTVSAVGNNTANGNFVIIKHKLDGETVYSFYCHLSKYTVSKGDSVSAGQKIGIVGNTGSSSAGTHLHFAVIDSLNKDGGYYGYVSKVKGNTATYSGRTYYNPTYILENGCLPN